MGSNSNNKQSSNFTPPAKKEVVEPVIAEVVEDSTPITQETTEETIAPVEVKVTVGEPDRLPPMGGTNNSKNFKPGVVVPQVIPVAEVVASPVSIDDLEGASQLAVITFHQILDYAEKMHPKRPVDPITGARHQVSFFRALVTMVNKLENEEFPTVFKLLLKLVEERKADTFAPTQVFRFFEHVALSKDERSAFEAFVEMLRVAAPVRGRDIALKHVDFSRALKSQVWTDQGRQRVNTYFSK